MAERTLVPLDGSPVSHRALEYALETHPDAVITVFHVIDPIASVYTAGTAGPSAGEAWYETAKERAADICSTAEAMAADYGIEVTTATEVGTPAREIVEYADEHAIDHVIMGSHGRTGVSHVLLGSVAEKVLRRASVPVTILR